MEDSPGERQNRHSSNLQADSDLSLPDDSDFDMVSRPTPAPVRRPGPVASSRPTPATMDAASAAKMMKKAIKDAQSDSARQRKKDENPKYDYFQFLREIGPQGYAIIGACIALLIGSLALNNYMSRTPLKTPPLGYVRGVIKLDGKPLPNAYIFFSPRKPLEQLKIAGAHRDRERASVGISDATGHFKMMYSMDEKIEGVAIGNCHVWVTHTGPRGSDVPFKWSEGAIHEEVVKAGTQNQFNIDMQSEPPGAAQPGAAQ